MGRQWWGGGLGCELFFESPLMALTPSQGMIGQQCRSVIRGGGVSGQLRPACQHCLWKTVGFFVCLFVIY